MAKILKELSEHIPFTLLATAIGIILAIAGFLTGDFFLQTTETIFEIMHPAHVLFSAFVTSALFYKYRKNFLLAILIGITGSIIIGTLSDVILPYLEGNLLNLHTHLHLPIIEEPLIILGAALLGSIIGIGLKSTKTPHLIHVLLSVFASLFYILAYSPSFNLIWLIAVFFIVFIAVLVPCCLSDIIYPLLFIRKK